MPRTEWLKRVGNEILDLVYPPGLYCICCGKIIDGSRTYRLCNECMGSLNWNTGRRCASCGRPLADTDPGELCFGCAQYEAAGRERCFDTGHACCGYGACAQSVIFSLKYGGHAEIGDTLGEIMYDYMLAEYGESSLESMYDIVMPVPVYADKFKKRGFDHAELIGRGFARRAGLRFDPAALIRLRETVPMKGLGPEARRANIRGAFGIRNSRLPVIQGAKILLVDDIFTTGSTVDEIASVLKAHGAAKVDFLAFAAAGDMVI